MKNSVAFTVLCNHYLVPKPFHRPQRKPIRQLVLIPPSPQPLASPSLFSVPMDFHIWDVLYKHNHTTCTLVWLASLTQHHIFKVHPHCSVYQNFFPFHGWIIFQGMFTECTWFPFLRSVLSLLPWFSVTRKSCCHYVFFLVLCTQRMVGKWLSDPVTLWTAVGQSMNAQKLLQQHQRSVKRRVKLLLLVRLVLQASWACGSSLLRMEFWPHRVKQTLSREINLGLRFCQVRGKVIQLVFLECAPKINYLGNSLAGVDLL